MCQHPYYLAAELGMVYSTYQDEFFHRELYSHYNFNIRLYNEECSEE